MSSTATPAFQAASVNAGRDWGQEEKGTTEDKMAGWPPKPHLPPRRCLPISTGTRCSSLFFSSSWPTEPKTAHQSYALCLQMDFPSALRGLEMGWTLAWGGVPGGGQAQELLRKRLTPRLDLWLWGRITGCFLYCPYDTSTPGGGAQETQGRGSFCPLYSDGESQAGGG